MLMLLEKLSDMRFVINVKKLHENFFKFISLCKFYYEHDKIYSKINEKTVIKYFNFDTFPLISSKH